MKNKKYPLVSIIMPVYNAGEFLKDSIQSIISQEYTNWELICVNDGSTDSTSSLLKHYQAKDSRIKIYKNSKKKGIGFSLNRALKLAKGDFIARMDADDISLPDRIGKQVNLLLSKANIVACGGQVAIIDLNNNISAHKKFPTKSQDLYDMIMSFVPIQHPVIMVRSDIFRKYRYDTSVSTAEDVDMLFYLLSKGEITNLNSTVYLYRQYKTPNANYNIKKAFYITFITRFKSIFKYGYRPSLNGIILSLLQFALITVLPQGVILDLFESFRFRQSILARISNIFTVRNPISMATGRNPM